MISIQFPISPLSSRLPERNMGIALGGLRLTHWRIFCSAQPLAMLFSPSLSTSFAIAAGLQKNGALLSIPKTLLFVLTFRTFRSTLGLNHTLSKNSRFPLL